MMQPTNLQTVDPEPPHGFSEPSSTKMRRAAQSVLAGLMGCQALPPIIIALYLFIGIFGPWLAPFDPIAENPEIHNCPPLAINALNTSDGSSDRASQCHATNIFGTDEVGRDIFSRLLHGARTSLLVVLPSVLIGTVVGSVICVLVNGWPRKFRMAVYAILGLTIVPCAVFVFGQPFVLWFLIPLDIDFDQGMDAWIVVMASSIYPAVLTFAVIAVAYQYDDTCRRSWFSEVDSNTASNGFSRLLGRQIGTLAPWIGLAALANAALVFVFLHSAPGILSPAIAWSFKWEYRFEHIGYLGPFLPMVLFPIGFVTFGVLWFVRLARGRFTTTSKATLGSAPSVADSAVELSTKEETDRFESPSSENDGNVAITKSGSTVKRRLWVMVVIATVAAAAVVRFGVAEAVPTVRVLAQDSAGSYESASAKSRQEWNEASDCAREISSRRFELELDTSESSGIEASQRCRELYFQYRNTPSHRHTIDYALRFLAQTLTLALVASIVSAVLWTAASGSTRAVGMTVEVFVVMVALVGLTMTFGFTGWHLAVFRWLISDDAASYGEQFAANRALSMVRDFAVAVGVSYLIITATKPILRFAKTVPTLDVLSKWASFFILCALFISGFLILFHYPFPSNIIFNDSLLSVIVDPWYVGGSAQSDLTFESWLWTYWFALMGYAAIVVGFFAAAIWGFMRYVRSDVNGVDSTPVSPDSPSRGADPI